METNFTRNRFKVVLHVNLVRPQEAESKHTQDFFAQLNLNSKRLIGSVVSDARLAVEVLGFVNGMKWSK